MACRVDGRGLLLLLLPVAVIAAGCSDEGGLKRRDRTTAAFCAIDGVQACHNADECGGGSACSEGCCLPACSVDGDCGAGACGPLGCVCDAGACRARVCSASGECASGQVCEAGACVAAPDSGAAASCVIAPRWAVLREGASLPLRVKAYDAAGEPLPLTAGFAFTSDEPARVGVDEAGIATGGASAGPAVITASIGSASCEAEIVAHPQVAAGSVRVVVIDELTGLPLEGALVQIETGAAPLSASTDAGGAATFDAAAVPGAPRTISALHDDFGWVTVAGTSADDLLLPLRRLVASDRAGGYQGTFGPHEIFHPDNVQAGVAGTSIPGNLIDLSPATLVGPSRVTRVVIGDERDVKIPSGVVLGLGNTWFKEAYQAIGTPGVCADRAASAAGTCGMRTAWGLAGGVPLLDLPIDELTEGGGADLGVGGLLSQLLPHFQRFRSAVVRDVAFDLQPKVSGAPDWSSFARRDLLATERLSLRSTVALPELPRAGEGWLDGVIVFGGADVPDRGVVPLGLTAGIDADPAAGGVPDGRIDDRSGVSNGEVDLRIAPLHGGLEGSDYVIVALAANFAGMSSDSGGCSAEDRSGCAVVSGLVDRAASHPFGRRVEFDAGFVEPASRASWDAATRTFTSGGAPAGANLLRVKLSAPDGKPWSVWMPSGTSELVLPSVSGADRAAGARASVQALRVGVPLDDLVSFDGTHLGDLGSVLSAFSTVDLP